MEAVVAAEGRARAEMWHTEHLVKLERERCYQTTRHTGGADWETFIDMFLCHMITDDHSNWAVREEQDRCRDIVYSIPAALADRDDETRDAVERAMRDAIRDGISTAADLSGLITL